MPRMFLAMGLVLVFLTSACQPSPEAIKQTLRDNPDILMDVLAEHKMELVELVQQGLKERSAKQAEERLQAELENPLEPVIGEDRIVFGNPEAPVAVVEYSDFLCPHCSRADVIVSGLLEGRDDLKLVFKHYPLHQNSLQAALVFEALGGQDKDKAWEFKKKLFAAQEEYAEKGLPVLKDILTEVGADPGLVETAVNDQDLVDRVLADIKEAESFGFKGTPTFLVGGVEIRGAAPAEEFERVIRLVEERQAAECDECTKQP